MENCARIVCDCMGVDADEVKKFMKSNPKADFDQICDALEIGAACGCCLEEDCKKIDISIVDLVKLSALKDEASKTQ